MSEAERQQHTFRGEQRFDSYSTRRSSSDLISQFIEQQRALQDYKNGKAVVADGYTLSIAAIVAVARFGARLSLDNSPMVRERVERSRKVLEDAVEAGTRIYGINTGVGGNSDVARTNNSAALGEALLQGLHAGILLPCSPSPHGLPLSDPLTSSSMPESWVRGAILVRINSLMRGHSAVRWTVLERMSDLLRENITPFVPLRGSISASGDLMPLSYIAGVITGNPSIRAFVDAQPVRSRTLVPSPEALAAHKLQPLQLLPKEHLGITNGTAFSASVAALVLHDAAHLALLAQVLTAMGTEALLGNRANYAPFTHETARPHPGQIESGRTIWELLEDSILATGGKNNTHVGGDHSEFKQDRYSLRTAPQFIGPQLEDIVSALNAVTVECNSTTDNPLFDGRTGGIHHGGNFQAQSVTNAMERTRLALHLIGKLLFSQCTELLNPSMNQGLPPNLASTDPSLNYFGKGLDVATAAYVSELGFLAHPVSTNIQSAEMNNESVNSLALVSARATVTSIDVLSMLSASYLYLLCQAVDIRAMQAEFKAAFDDIVLDGIQKHLSGFLSTVDDNTTLLSKLLRAAHATLDKTSTMDVIARMVTVAEAFLPILVATSARSPSPPPYSVLIAFCDTVATRASQKLADLRKEYLTGARGPAPASAYLAHTRPMYNFVRIDLGIGMHGKENRTLFDQGLGFTERSIGESVSLIHEAIRDGRMQKTAVGLF
ncbi:phenylalanine ammonium lyase [Vararia minispora EC-137]|uniref:Phenylalanine ammonium lyase n=1 Tax=Vararia minispora EC-137 TaxID=1314806 RepID=A0ACB8QCA8_9AGAM|nr:phenylalanine ammonium lyase [Vararia minispora EC-137]